MLLPRTEGSRLEKLIIEGEAELGVLAHCLHTSAYVSIRTHTSADVSRRQQGEAELGVLAHCLRYVSRRKHTSAYVSTRQHKSAHVSTRQHTSAHVSIRRSCALPAVPAYSCGMPMPKDHQPFKYKHVKTAKKSARRGGLVSY
jgi:hypothetical protein